MLTMRRFLSFLFLASSLSSVACIGSGHSINAYGGTRSLDTDDFGSIDDQTVYGADLVLKFDLPWLAAEGGFFYAEEDDGTAGALTDVELSVEEYFVGLRVTPWDFLIQPYASAGVTLVDGTLDATSGGMPGETDDDTLAYYARLGAAFTIAFFRIGLDGRALFGSDLDLDTIESDVDNYQVTAFVGIGF